VLAKLGADYRGEILPGGQLLLPSSLQDAAKATPER